MDPCLSLYQHTVGEYTMPLNILEIAKTADEASWQDAYGFKLHWGQHSERERSRILALASAVATRTIERCSQEVSSVAVQAPDAQIVKDKITAAFRLLAADASMQSGKIKRVY